jgi:hypothetical protein
LQQRLCSWYFSLVEFHPNANIESSKCATRES